ncbi:MAG: S24 family peptidase, partial [Pontibacterium sp.]
NDNSCLPMYGPGTSFVISHQKPIAGDLVLAILPDGQNAIRYYKRPTPESYSLVPINDDYAPYELNDTSRDNIIGTVCLIISLPPNARK